MKVSSVKVDIAPAELIDKITILSIKSERIDDVEKRKNVQSELDILTATRDQVIQSSISLDDLLNIVSGLRSNVYLCSLFL